VLTPRAYRIVTLVVLFLLAFIIVTGGAVRLTGSGLGCPQWPNCEDGSLVPHSAANQHAMIEFVNRLVTGLVSLGVIVAVLGSLRRQPRRRDLVWLSLGLVGGVLGQIVLGGITVLVHLHPVAVMSHFLLSMVIVANAVVLHSRAGDADGQPRRRIVSGPSALLPLGALAWSAVVIVTGTIVTASGPHGGDEDVRRLGFQVADVARIHGTSVVILLTLVVATLFHLRRTGAPAALQRRGSVFLIVLVAQAAVGYVQYFTGVPVLLVGVHIFGAVTVWVAALRFALATRSVAASREAHGTGETRAADPAVPARVLG
jgi:cytochrome c oxidase assembly protein subunit 15